MTVGRAALGVRLTVAFVPPATACACTPQVLAAGTVPNEAPPPGVERPRGDATTIRHPFEEVREPFESVTAAIEAAPER